MDEKLIEAAEYLENHHTTGTFQDPNGLRCLVGGIVAAHLGEEFIAYNSEESFNKFLAMTEVSCPVGKLLPETRKRFEEVQEPFLASIARVAAVLPPPTFDRADGPGDRCSGQEFHDYDFQHDDAVAEVIHYNDYHCKGGVEAAKLCREAAEVEL